MSPQDHSLAVHKYLPSLPSQTGSYIATENFEEAIAKYDENHAEAVRFWFYLGKERGWPLAKLQAASGVSTGTLSRVFRGSYGAELDSVVEKLERAKLSFMESSENPDFIETSLSRKLFAIADKTRALQNVSIAWGEMGIGKTTILSEYKRLNNHGHTYLVRFPAGCTFTFFVHLVASAFGLAIKGQNQFILRKKIIKTLSAGKRLLIIDELHQAFLTTGPGTTVRCCEFLREIKDESDSGLMLVGTKVLRDQLTTGPHKDVLGQLMDRGTIQIPLPPKATKGDVKAFLAHYGLKVPGDNDHPDASAILDDIIKSSGLRKLTMHLRDGAAYSNKKGETYTWSHFVAAFDAIQALSKS